MRLWTIHPKYLDAAGLVALWREALLAQKVLLGKTRGYVNHPQLDRFRASPDPAAFIAAFLKAVLEEADARGYSFDRTRITAEPAAGPLDETDGQLAYEWNHYKKKIFSRNRALYDSLEGTDLPDPHPLFRIIPGPVEPWEKTGKAG
ncbi:MAG: pyrimidine dimer DNA glycosylase/endonuclease V [Spirochaetes bacterium]|nr:pyrimidine dimer DNA glycosylase/endonuclease V [Spirochaetota bacterium]